MSYCLSNDRAQCVFNRSSYWKGLKTICHPSSFTRRRRLRVAVSASRLPVCRFAADDLGTPSCTAANDVYVSSHLTSLWPPTSPALTRATLRCTASVSRRACLLADSVRCSSRDRRCSARAAVAPGCSGLDRSAPAALPTGPASGAGLGAKGLICWVGALNLSHRVTQ